MRHYGVPFSPMVMIPFLGASIQMDGNPRNAWEEAHIAFGGPVAGTAGAFALMALGQTTGSQLCYSLADFGFMINLFNLLPVQPMDGGRVANAISPYFSGAGAAAGIFVAYQGYIANPIFYLVVMAGTYDSVSRLLGWSQRPPGYYNIGPGKQASLMAAYLALVGTLLYGMRENNKKRKTPRQLENERQRGWSDNNDAAPWENDPGAKYDDFFADNRPPPGGWSV